MLRDNCLQCDLYTTPVLPRYPGIREPVGACYSPGAGCGIFDIDVQPSPYHDSFPPCVSPVAAYLELARKIRMKRNEGMQSRARFCFSLDDQQHGRFWRTQAVFTMGGDLVDDGTTGSRSGEG